MIFNFHYRPPTHSSWLHPSPSSQILVDLGFEDASFVDMILKMSFINMNFVDLICIDLESRGMCCEREKKNKKNSEKIINRYYINIFLFF